MNIHTRLMLSVAVAALCFAAASPATAAEDVTAAPDSTAVSEVVVTSAKLQGLGEPVDSGPLGAKSILDTPFSVTVVDAEEIELRQPQTIAQLFVNDPSVFSFASAGTVNWWGTQIRGLGVRNYYVDDVPLVLYWGGDYPLESVETVQALKGATGFMYGFGAPGGAISYRTKRPTAERTLSTELGWRGISVLTSHLDAGGPVNGSDDLGYRLTLSAEKGEEYNGAEIQRGVASLAVDWDISPTLTWRNNITYEATRLDAEPFHLYWSYAGDRLPSVPDDYDNLRIDNSSYGYETLTATTKLEWQINAAWSADLVQGYTRKRHRSNKTFVYVNNDQGDYDGYLYRFGELDVVNFTQAMLQGEFRTGPVRHEIVVGAAHQVYEADFGNNGWLSAFSGNLSRPQPYRLPGKPDYSTDGWPSKERQDSVFVSDTLHFGDHWQAIVGLRYTDYDLEDLDGDPTTPSGSSTAAVTPTLAVLYKPSPRATLYASYVESLEGGAVVWAPYSNEGDVLDAAISKQYEAGAKYDGERLSFTTAIFRMERSTQIDQVVGADRFLTQDGISVYDGIEASGQFKLTDDLTIGLGATKLDASIEDVSPGNEALRGNRPAETAKWQVVGNFEYNVSAIRGLSLHGNIRYYGDAPTGDDNLLIIPDYTLVGVGFQYRTEIGGRPVAFTGNINNLLNEKYWGLQNLGESINGSLSVTVDW